MLLRDHDAVELPDVLVFHVRVGGHRDVAPRGGHVADRQRRGVAQRRRDRERRDRRESAEDRRSRLIALTDDGRAVVDRVLRARLKTLEQFAEELTPEERATLTAALLPIVERIAPP